VQIDTEGPGYDHAAFKPWRIQALAFKAIRRLYPGYPLWRDFAYEHEREKLAIDVINGGPLLRVGGRCSRYAAGPGCAGGADEQGWLSERQGVLRLLTDVTLASQILTCHARPCAGHPRLNHDSKQRRGWPGRARP
jgi:hypothetical protein